MDASVVITMEWKDKNLFWETGKITIPTREPSTQTTVTPSSTQSVMSPTPTAVSTTTTTATTTTTSTKAESQAKNKKDETDEITTSQVNINSIRADKSQVWIPEIEILNRVNDFSPIDEKQRQLKIVSSGKVRYTRAYRMRAMLSSSLAFYPYDVQVNTLSLARGILNSRFTVKLIRFTILSRPLN